jgi:hypothetical protein
MTTWERAFNVLYAAQTRNLGAEIVATIGDFAIGKPAILGVVTKDEMLMDGGGGRAEAGGYSLQMKSADFTAVPPKETAVIVNGDAAGFSLEVDSIDRANGMLTIHVIDVAAV